MQVHRLRLVNFRQHEDTDLRFAPGLTGVIGPNGSGKTTLLEALAWAIYGSKAARGTAESIRRRNAPPRARVEASLEFSLGAHRYRVVRTLHAAELYQDAEPTPIADSPSAVTERLTRILGMTRDEFFNTYFTGQKELAIMSSMTAKERSKPELINAKRKIRIAKGSGTTVQEVNKLLKMHQEMANAMKRLKKMGGLGKLAAMFGKGGLEGALGGLAPGAMPPGGLGGGAALPGLGGGSPFNLPPGYDKFTKK